MKESPILFNTDMVKAILDGSKTQTRRVFKDHPRLASDISKIDLIKWFEDYPDYLLSFSPFGKKGDLLWVRETFAITTTKQPHFSTLSYKADSFHKDIMLPGKQYFKSGMCEEGWTDPDLAKEVTWKPSIHMPKGFARIWLKITDIRVERLQKISVMDARAEGIEQRGIAYKDYLNGEDVYMETTSFRTLWDSTTKKHFWQSNPWVWVITFERIIK